MMESVIICAKGKNEISYSDLEKIEKQLSQLKGICIEVHGLFTENEIYRNGVDDGYKWLEIEVCCHNGFYEGKDADWTDVEGIIEENIDVDYFNNDSKPIDFWA